MTNFVAIVLVIIFTVVLTAGACGRIMQNNEREYVCVRLGYDEYNERERACISREPQQIVFYPYEFVFDRIE